ncbi:Uncharacterised protein [Rothia dentocariosa]|nr:Uncharacterised protein [Rothia dentocariosa]
MIMNNEPVEENSKPAVSDKSKTDVMRSRSAKIHISSELLRTSIVYLRFFMLGKFLCYRKL